MSARYGELLVTYTKSGSARYAIEVWHDRLNKHRVIKGDDQSLVLRKAQVQIKDWEERWAVVVERDKLKAQRTAGKQEVADKRQEAVSRTEAATAETQVLMNLLSATLSVDDRLDWNSLKNRAPFPETAPKINRIPPKPVLGASPQEPAKTDQQYVPKIGILDRLMGSRKAKKFAEASLKFEQDHSNWVRAIAHQNAQFEESLRAFEVTKKEAEDKHAAAQAQWSVRRDEYEAERIAGNKSIDTKRTEYGAKNPDTIMEYCDYVLSASDYPDYFPQEFEVDYDQSGKVIIVDYKLPAPDDLPRLKAVKYVASRDDFDEAFLSDSQFHRLYDSVLYQVVLRTVHELFEADVVKVLEAVVVNGIVTATDRTTGKMVSSCILSLRASKSEFLDINLAGVDPKACFKSLKGVGSSKLHGLAPVPPIMPMRREDGRFVSAYDVADTLDGSVNLASMNWEDFEHLIREVFEKEFSSTGGEVRVTQASRDGGVDAIAYDPDPIRGGKIVIQAKRYTNTVGVAAVRDLYGTVVNEGATKGILVTTSDYGPDSYAFANSKPIVLLNGANLLHMLEKHGHRAKIDIAEARRLIR